MALTHFLNLLVHTLVSFWVILFVFHNLQREHILCKQDLQNQMKIFFTSTQSPDESVSVMSLAVQVSNGTLLLLFIEMCVQRLFYAEEKVVLVLFAAPTHNILLILSFYTEFYDWLVAPHWSWSWFQCANTISPSKSVKSHMLLLLLFSHLFPPN